MTPGAFGWRDALDVVLVALVIYRIFTLFRGTRAMQMLVGVGVLVAASLAARQLELHSLGWLLDTLWSFWVVVLVVLFQPELRRALTSIGHAAVLRTLFGGGGVETVRVVDEIASVAGSLAERRIGALIVIERGTGLRQYAELGVALDALVSADLLTSLFLPYSPLHDGAAFIRDDRVVAAGCFLPLSRNLQLARQLGTRHRAALGVTEETDAVAVVVSEETGRLSLAVDGGIEALAGPDGLRRRLLTLLGAKTEGVPAFWRGWLRALRFRARPAGPPSSSAH
ncbi:MAG: TIGR00159 family protein [Candidatus Rokuibacteriota bacterium]|nr:MAG: TIGR00159 family protein [Candidatus Rokubacteria bacterium]PYN21780.1 MAG: TIGR00159 family protein [Candidatus Rokubacteria bacterium]